jgi:formamidopyrimidine-DNA glycosylase
VFRCTIPEGPEVKLSADLIRPLLVGKRVINAFPGKTSRYASSNPEGFAKFLDALSNGVVRVDKVEVKGKFMYWTFSNGWFLMNTFGMSGQWSPTEGKHPSFGFYLGEDPLGSFDTMYFNDPRHFGTVKFTSNAKDLADKLDELGWDPLAMPVQKNLPWIKQQLKKTSKSIAEVLMDQGVFTGVGNYIRAEALYLSKLSPWRQSNLLTDDEVELLCKSIVSVMEESYQHQGATIHTYKTAYGEEGRYSTLFKVYGQKKDPMGLKVIKQQTPDKRSIHWCPEVQV